MTGSEAAKITARSMTLRNSRTLPGQPHHGADAFDRKGLRPMNSGSACWPLTPSFVL
jgi:hypothetical protein